MKLEFAIPLALLGFRTQFAVAQELLYGYSTGCECAEIITTTVYLPRVCLPAQETSTALGNAVNPSASSLAIKTTSTEITTPMLPLPTVTSFSQAADTSTRVTATLQTTVTLEEPEEFSTETPLASASSTLKPSLIVTSTEILSSETESPSVVPTWTLDESTSEVIETATATTEFPALFSTSNSGLYTSSNIETASASSTFIYSATSEFLTESTSIPKTAPQPTDLSTSPFQAST